MSPPPRRTSALAARTSSDPWTMRTLPVNTQGPPSSPTEQSLASEVRSMGWLRSLDFAQAPPAARAAARARSVGRLAARRDIAGVHLGGELDALAGQVGFPAGALHGSARLGDGHGGGAARPARPGQRDA